MDILYFGARPRPSLIRMLAKQGYTVIYARYKKGILASISTCTAVVLHWKSKKDQQVIAETRAALLPIMVITANLVEAYGAGDPLAELYLEQPALDEDVASLVIDMIGTERDTGQCSTGRRGMGIAA